MDTAERSVDETTSRSRSRSVAVGVAAVLGLVVGVGVGVMVGSEGSVPEATDPAQIIASTVDDLNTAYVYGDMATIEAIFGDDVVFSFEGRDMVGPAGADFFGENAGTGAVARRVTEPTANADGTYTFVMELLPPNQLQPFVFEVHTSVESGRLVRLEQGDRIFPDDSDG